MADFWLQELSIYSFEIHGLQFLKYAFLPVIEVVPPLDQMFPSERVCRVHRVERATKERFLMWTERSGVAVEGSSKQPVKVSRKGRGCLANIRHDRSRSRRPQTQLSWLVYSPSLVTQDTM